MNGAMTRISAEKDGLRAQMKALGQALTQGELRDQSRSICRWLSSELEPCPRVMLYVPTSSEVDVWPLASWLMDRKIEVALPRVDWTKQQMVAYAYSGDESALELKGPGIRQPPADAEVYERDSLDAVVVPGVAFDAVGGRLGRGGGFYDRFLAGAPDSVRTIGVGFTHQFLSVRVDSVPREPHDQLMDAVVTPAGVVRIGTRNAGGGQ